MNESQNNSLKAIEIIAIILLAFILIGTIYVNRIEDQEIKMCDEYVEQFDDSDKTIKDHSFVIQDGTDYCLIQFEDGTDLQVTVEMMKRQLDK